MYDMGANHLEINNVSHLWRDTTSINRFVFRDKKTCEIVSQLNDIPYYDNDIVRWVSYTNASYSISPDKSKLAIATRFGLIAEFIDISGSRIERINTKYFIKPDFDVVTGGYKGFNENTIGGLSDIYSSNQYLYGSYDGKKLKGNTDLLFTNLVIFDWKGNALKKIDTDYRIVQLCVDGNTLFAAIKDIDGRVFLAKLEL